MLIAAWVGLPLLLGALALGCGLLVEVVIRRRLPGALLIGAGLATIIVVGQFLTYIDATAELTIPAVVALAVIGLGVGWPRLRLPDPPPVVAALAVLAVFAAPIVLSGEATFAGYIKLDDTATWVALTDRIMEHGRSLDGLAPSSYEATLAFNLGAGYPIGVFVPLGVVAGLTGIDVAWLVQPYMAFIGIVLALALWELAGWLLERSWLRAAVAFVGAQPALLYGYYLWGGIKEMAAAAMIATTIALLGAAVRNAFAPAALATLALGTAALIGVLSAGGILWLLPALLAAMALAIAVLGPRVAILRGAAFAVLVALLALPSLLPGLKPPTSSPLTSSSAIGNLLGPLDPLQVAGIWPAGDFRVDPSESGPAHVLIAIAALAAIAMLVLAWRRRAIAPLLYVAGTLIAAFVIYAIGSPWVDGKALATASPVIPFAAALAAAALWATGRRVEGGVLLVAIAGGVLWSNVLAYHDVNLAPRNQLAELEDIGGEIGGQGPTLMTEYQPYGVRHFLRDADPEGVSELRRRQVPLRGGGVVPKGETADTDQLDPAGLLQYRTLVLRRSPSQSRPPSPYRLVSRGEYYEVWQRDAGAVPAGLQHLGLGDEVNPVGTVPCERLRRVVAGAAPTASLLAARRPRVTVVPLSQTDYPPEWVTAPGAGDSPTPSGPGEIVAAVRVPEAGDYEFWLGGSVRPAVDLEVDGREVDQVRHQLQNFGEYTRLGSAVLSAGSHRVTIRFHGGDARPGSGGAADPIGPLVLSDSDAADARIERFGTDQVDRLCNGLWDWVELVP